MLCALLCTVKVLVEARITAIETLSRHLALRSALDRVQQLQINCKIITLKMYQLLHVVSYQFGQHRVVDSISGRECLAYT